jgi:phosphonopyruvate decarboxylase
MDETGRPYALLMQKGSVAATKLEAQPAARVNRHAPPVLRQRNDAPRSALASRNEALRQVIASTPPASSVVLASTGFCGRELYAIDDRPNQLYMVGSMGCVVPLALGLSLARPDLRVVALDGDGAALMRMGAFATVGAYGMGNLWHLLLDNGVHDSTGAQATVSPNLSFASIAAACGYAASLGTTELSEVAAWFDSPPLNGPRFACLSTRPGTPGDLPRPAMTPVEVKDRLMSHIASGAQPRVAAAH